jgi:hypothetical protein
LEAGGIIADGSSALGMFISSVANWPRPVWLVCLFGAIVPSAVNSTINTWATQRASPTTVAIYITIEPILTAAFAAWWLGEHALTSWQEIVGALMIMAGVFAVVMIDNYFKRAVKEGENGMNGKSTGLPDVAHGHEVSLHSARVSRESLVHKTIDLGLMSATNTTGPDKTASDLANAAVYDEVNYGVKRSTSTDFSVTRRAAFSEGLSLLPYLHESVDLSNFHEMGEMSQVGPIKCKNQS